MLSWRTAHVLSLALIITAGWLRTADSETLAQRDAGVTRSMITIGAVLPLTGDAAQWGIPPRNGAQLAIDEVNQANVTNGPVLALSVEDDRCQPTDGVSAFNKLMATAAPPIVLGAVCSSVTLAIAPLAERRAVVLISPASTSPKLTNAGDFVFRVVPSDDLRGKIFAEYVFRDRGLRKVAILYVNNEGGVGNRNSFNDRFTELGGSVSLEEVYAQGSTDIRTQITKIKASDASAVIVVSYPQDTVLVMQQARELRLDKPLFFQTEAVEDPNVLREAGDAANGAVYILPAPPIGPSADTFVKAYVSKFGKKPELFAAEAYDIVKLVAKAASSTQGPVTGSSIQQYLYSLKNYSGASGTITIDEHGDVIKPFAIKVIKNAEPTTLEVK
jgi:branched-chain amino acid transport system substrate-binding protein